MERLKKILDELSEGEERKRFRIAVNEVWQAEEVEKRRRAMQEANLAYRKALQDEIGKLKVSPKVRSVLMRLLQSRFRNETRAIDGAGSPRDASCDGGCRSEGEGAFCKA